MREIIRFKAGKINNPLPQVPYITGSKDECDRELQRYIDLYNSGKVYAKIKNKGQFKCDLYYITVDKDHFRSQWSYECHFYCELIP